MHIAVLETQSNQPYIFASNRQAAALGASQLLLESCTKWVLEECVPSASGDLTSTHVRREVLGGQPPLDALPQGDIHVAVATSGRAVLISERREDLEDKIFALTLRALREAPGMGLTAGIAEFQRSDSARESESRLQEAAPVWRAMSEASLRAKRNWMQATRPEMRFTRMPLLRDCNLSSYPASCRVRTPDDVDEFRSLIVHRQIEARDRALERIRQQMRDEDAGVRIAKEIDDLGSGWQAVIHADSNGFGALFSALGKVLPRGDSECIESYRKFSLDLEQVTITSLAVAIRQAPARPSVYPIVFGGDDVTLVARGEVGLDLVQRYLDEFSRRASEVLQELPCPEDLRDILPPSLSASAGVAFVKPGHPFFSAYELADELTSSAKRPYRGQSTNEHMVSAIDFHLLFDSTSSTLDAIRERRQGSNPEPLHGGPYDALPSDASTPTRANLPKLSDLRAAAKELFRARPVLRNLRATLGTTSTTAEAQLRSAKSIRRINQEEFERIVRLMEGRQLLDVIDLVDIEVPAVIGEGD